MLNRIFRIIILIVLLLVFRFGIISALIFFPICLLFFSWQAILPIRPGLDFFQVFNQLISFMLRVNGPTAKIINGRFEQARGLRNQMPGVVLLDINSAVVLERVVLPGFIAYVDYALQSISRWITNLFRSMRGLPALGNPAPVRVCGPGLTFVEFDERIQGVTELQDDNSNEPVETISGLVDLRRQFRKSGRSSDNRQDINNASVRAYTRDGIELGTNVNGLFTIGQDLEKSPHVLHIGFKGNSPNDWQPDNLRVLTIREQNDSVMIQSMADELEEDDRQDVFEYFSSLDNPPEFTAYEPLPTDPLPPTFNASRVFSAVYSQAFLRDNPVQMLPWTDLPVRHAVDIFREFLSQINLNELYTHNSDGVLGINGLRYKLRIKMRNSGMLCYRLIMRQVPRPIRVGQIYPYNILVASPVQAMSASRVLRDRGIQILSSGFGPLLPTNDIYSQWLNNWRAEWERETMTTQAIADLEARRIYNRARIQKQQELAINLREIFEDTNNSKEVIAIRLLQALESIAADRDTRRLLPAETINILQSIRSWLLPEDSGGFMR
jgi:hypothetical protein